MLGIEVDIDFIEEELRTYMKIHNITGKFTKACEILKQNIFSRSTNLEKLAPKSTNIYSFRIDQKYRVLCIKKGQKLFVFDITNHYH